jgi:hypothetical protein
VWLFKKLYCKVLTIIDEFVSGKGKGCTCGLAFVTGADTLTPSIFVDSFPLKVSFASADLIIILLGLSSFL